MMTPKKTVLFVDRLGAQSIWSLLAPIAQALQAQGHTVHRCYWDDGRTAYADDLDGAAQEHVISVPPGRGPRNLIRQHRAFKRPFENLLAQIKPDIVHCNFIIPAGWATYLARRAGVPCRVITRHETGTSLSPHLTLWSKISTRFATDITYVSQYVAETYGQSTNARITPRHHVIPNGINHEFLHQISPSERQTGDKVYVIAGRMVPEKGHMRALDAFARVHVAQPQARLELIGDGPQAASLKERCAKLGLQGNVDFLGWMTRSQALARMKSAHAILIPSAQEGFGLVLAEAMALHVPVIASDIAAFHEVANHGQDVTLVPTQDTDCFAQACLAPLKAATLPAQALSEASMVAAYLHVMLPNLQPEEVTQ